MQNIWKLKQFIGVFVIRFCHGILYIIGIRIGIEIGIGIGISL